METIFETENISLDFDESRPYLKDLGEYRIELYDIHGHYEDSFYISAVQLKDLIDNMRDVEIKVKNNFL